MSTRLMGADGLTPKKVDHSKILSRVKKRGEISGVFLWSKVFLDKGIANRILARPKLTR